MTERTPSNQGYFMPAEWEPHEGTWLQWPHDDTHPNTQIRMEHIWLAMTAALHQYETVHITVPDERRRDHLQQQVRYYCFNESNIDFHIIPTNDVWSRDCGPIFLVNEQRNMAVTEWNFNGWGGRFPFDKDHLVAMKAAETLRVPVFTAPITLEGGAIEVNGEGTLIATRSSIINPNRNPGKNQEVIESALKQYLGVKHIIWLSGAPKDFCDAVGSSTDFHIDGYARFVDESTVLYTWTDDQTNVFYPYLKKHLDELRKAVTESGKSLTLVPLPMTQNANMSTRDSNTQPPFESKPSLALYTNFYIANDIVLLPVYGDVNDTVAMSIISEHFPDRDIVTILAQKTAELGGMMHCVTQQQPLPGEMV